MKRQLLPLLLMTLALGCLTPAHAGQEADLLAKIQKAAASSDAKTVINLSESLKKLQGALVEPAPPTEIDQSNTTGDGKDDFLKRMHKAGFSLQLTPDDDNPAKFAFTRDIQAGTGTVYTADFFLSWKTTNELADSLGWRQKTWDMNAGASVQGKLTSASDSEHDAWRFRATLSGRYTINPTSEDLDRMGGIRWSLSAKDEASRNFDFNRIGAEASVTPTVPALAMGVFKGSKDVAQFRWRPYLGLDAGSTTSDKGASADGADDTLWLTGRTTAKLKLNFLTNTLKMNEVSLYADDKIVYLSEAGTWHNYLKTGINFMFTDSVGLSLDYSIGEDSPQFTKEKSLNGAFTIKF